MTSKEIAGRVTAHLIECQDLLQEMDQASGMLKVHPLYGRAREAAKESFALVQELGQRVKAELLDSSSPDSGGHGHGNTE